MAGVFSPRLSGEILNEIYDKNSVCKRDVSLSVFNGPSDVIFDFVTDEVLQHFTLVQLRREVLVNIY